MIRKKQTMKGRWLSPIYFIPTLAILFASLGVSAVPFTPPGDATNNINIIAFPQRDFISSTGYLATDRVVVRIIHSAAYGGGTLSTDDSTRQADGTSKSWIKPQGDPADLPGQFSGIVEVNHPGGACWINRTPDIRPGDTVQIEIMADFADMGDGDPIVGGRVGRIDETVVQNVTAKRPVQTAVDTVVIHGTAQDNAGAPLPVSTLEHRLVAPGEAFDLSNGKRTLRAASIAGTGIQGTLVYDPGDGNINWTATYNGLTPHDVTIALGAESRGMWINVNPANALAGEITTYEIGGAIAPGPAAPCSAPLEVLPPPPGSELEPPTQPTNLTAAVDNSNTVTLQWSASTDYQDAAHTIPGAVTAYGIYRDGQNIFTLSKPDGSPYDPITEPTITFVDRNTPPGKYTYTVKAFDEVGNGSIESDLSNQIEAIHRIAEKDYETLLPTRFHNPPELPTSIIAFPSRDFISPSGYIDGDTVTVELLRKGPDGKYIIVSSAEGIIPDAETFAEVNHPGARCWEGVTPDVRVGDIVRTIAYNDSVTDNVDHIRSIDQTPVSGVTAKKPEIVQNATPDGAGGWNNDGIVTVKGTALGADGNPLPLDQIEQRMIARHGQGLYDLNGKRALRAANGADGTLEYDTVDNPMGVNWTATYSNLSGDDVARIVGGTSVSTGTEFPGADTRIHWLGRNPLLLNEATIFENAPDGNPPGPAGPGCTRPLEAIDTVDPSQPGSFTASVNANQDQVTFQWTQATDDWYVAGYRIYDDSDPTGKGIANAGPNATSITLSNIKPGIHKYSIKTFDTASPRGAGAPLDYVTQIINGLGDLYGNTSSRLRLTAVTGGTLGGDGSITLSDVQPPSAPANLIAVVSRGTPSGANVEFTWDPATDNIGVTRYKVIRDSSGTGSGGVVCESLVANVTTCSYNMPSAGSFDYFVEACDAAGNCNKSASITVTISDEFDAVAPEWPVATTVTAVNPDIHTRNVTVTWTAATDNLGIVRYDIFRANNAAPTGVLGEKIATVAAGVLTYPDIVPAAGTYRYALKAFDSAGNPTPLSPVSSAVVVANDTPVAGHSLIGFPARDFISATGYTPGNNHQFSVWRDNALVFTSQTNPADATGTIEVNHPAAAPQPSTCWLTNTPDLRAGDVIRILDTTTGIADQTTLYNVTAERPVVSGALSLTGNTVVVHGTAALADGTTQVPLAQMEHRLIANKISKTSGIELFDKNGRRDLRGASGLDGTFAYDAPNSTKWTATYTGLTLNDVYRIVGGTYTDATGSKTYPGAESRAVWLGRAPLALLEATIFENGVGVLGGPFGAPCTAGLEPSAAANLDTLNVALPSTQYKPVQQTSASQTITLSNGGATPLSITNIYFAGVNPGDFIRTGGTCPVVFPANLSNTPGLNTCTINVALRPNAVGFREANLSVTGNAANQTDLSVTLTGFGNDNTDPMISVSPSTKNFGTVNGGSAPTQVFTVTNTSNDPTGRSLTVSAANIGGANASDFSITANTCGGALLPADPGTSRAAGTCNITVKFTPGARAARLASLNLTHNAVLPNGLTTTAITLTGTGGNGSVLSFNANPVTFGTVTRTTSKDQTVSVKNSGNQAATLNLASFTVTGAGFSKVSTTCGTLAVNSSCNVVVRFTAPNTVGAFVGGLTVKSANGLPTDVTTSLSASTK